MQKDNRFGHVFQTTLFPLIVLGLLVVFIIVYRLLGLPNSDELIALSNTYLSHYGYWIVLAAAFVEAIPPVNFYFPGSAIVVLSVAFARQGTLNVFGVLGIAAMAFFLAYILDYVIGRYGWSWVLARCGLGPALERSRMKITTYGLRWLWWSYVHPNLGAISATSCGILQIPFWRFLLHSAGAIIIWVVFWGTLAYLGGNEVIKFLDIRWLVLIILIWLIISVVKRVRVEL